MTESRSEAYTYSKSRVLKARLEMDGTASSQQTDAAIQEITKRIAELLKVGGVSMDKLRGGAAQQSLKVCEGFLLQLDKDLLEGEAAIVVNEALNKAVAHDIKGRKYTGEATPVETTWDDMRKFIILHIRSKLLRSSGVLVSRAELT